MSAFSVQRVPSSISGAAWLTGQHVSKLRERQSPPVPPCPAQLCAVKLQHPLRARLNGNAATLCATAEGCQLPSRYRKRLDVPSQYRCMLVRAHPGQPPHPGQRADVAGDAAVLAGNDLGHAHVADLGGAVSAAWHSTAQPSSTAEGDKRLWGTGQQKLSTRPGIAAREEAAGDERPRFVLPP